MLICESRHWVVELLFLFVDDNFRFLYNEQSPGGVKSIPHLKIENISSRLNFRHSMIGECQFSLWIPNHFSISQWFLPKFCKCFVNTENVFGPFETTEVEWRPPPSPFSLLNDTVVYCFNVAPDTTFESFMACTRLVQYPFSRPLWHPHFDGTGS